MGLTEQAIKVLLHCLGLVGMAGVYLVPARVWSVVVRRRIGPALAASSRAYVVTSIVLVPAVFAIFVGSETIPRVFACLWDMKCTANRAGGLINLAAFGASVLILEVAWALAKALWSRWNKFPPAERVVAPTLGIEK